MAEKDSGVCSRGADKEQCVELCISCGKQQIRWHLGVTEGSVTEQNVEMAHIRICGPSVCAQHQCLNQIRHDMR